MKQPLVDFGKYKQLTIAELAVKDISYFRWAMSEVAKFREVAIKNEKAITEEYKKLLDKQTKERDKMNSYAPTRSQSMYND
tara:strand:+ start:692 stop:934 length:243 start_codon:yes stop_codon:yes gene_type:complete